MGAFAGWDMPIQYQGTMSEHQAVRGQVGVFDLSHLGKVEVRGDGAHDTLQHTLSNDLDRLTEPGAQYTLCLTDEGTIVDDLIVYREADGYLLVPNAANWPKVADAAAGLRRAAPGHPAARHRRARRPGRAPPSWSGACSQAADLPYAPGRHHTYRDAPARCRTGYTGERGFELLVPGEVAPALWAELFERGAPLQVVPVGLGGRDTLRLEMGYALHATTSPPTPTRSRPAWAGPWPWARTTSAAARPCPQGGRPQAAAGRPGPRATG